MSQESKEKSQVNILLLEDEEVLAQLYSEKLTEEGFQVLLYQDTASLVKDLPDLNFDVAFLDYSLHGDKMSGIDIIPLLKEKKPNIKIIMLSNYSEFQMEQKAKKAGATDYLLKIDTPPSILVDYIRKLTS